MPFINFNDLCWNFLYKDDELCISKHLNTKVLDHWFICF